MTDNHLQDVLTLLYNHKRYYLYIDDVRESIWPNYPEISLIETLLILEKLVRDGYVTEESQVEASIKQPDKVNDRYGYFITFEGIQLIEAGGYPALRIKEAKSQRFERRKQQLELRQIRSTISASNIQKYTFWVTFFASLSALAVSLVSLKKDKPTIVNPVIVLTDTILKSKQKDTVQLQIQLYQSDDTLKK